MERAFLGAALGVVLCADVQAGQWAVLVNGHAMHLEETKKGSDNEDNYGLGIEYGFTSSGRLRPFLFANGFRDSNEDPSYAVGGGYRLRLIDRAIYLDGGFAAMLMTRHDYRDGDPFPALLPVVTIGVGAIGMNVLYAPDIGPTVPLIFFQLRIAPAESRR